MRRQRSIFDLVPTANFIPLIKRKQGKEKWWEEIDEDVMMVKKKKLFTEVWDFKGAKQKVQIIWLRRKKSGGLVASVFFKDKSYSMWEGGFNEFDQFIVTMCDLYV